MKVLVLGVSGLIGSTIFRVFCGARNFETLGVARSLDQVVSLNRDIEAKIVRGVNVLDHHAVEELVRSTRPSVIINCVGVTKHEPGGMDPLVAIPVNSLFPHRLYELCRQNGVRLIHISTDCVFSGTKGGYSEVDHPDARDIYGLSKFMGELNGPNCITIRTSTIGHERSSKNGLLEWFLAQSNSCCGYDRAVFSGLPTVTLARVLRDYVISDARLNGLFHIGSEPIDKYTLLCMLADSYKKNIDILPDSRLIIDRSLKSDRFRSATGYRCPPWSQLISEMVDDFRDMDSYV